ncbi:Nramp family divalent metal transporter [Herbaspirillum sp. RTI4]|uniref:Nramp family divalent metal transporter n=1 Tax=Herbaspirillum sp. RTI4 TaxID=3048640 RepID=UPI002AB4FAF9|nr:Nramp family divalent metal transporter [Herbaspirillum sp. RTI4]MDY7578387.1 Nramp family divalent metal transporter [Herbaspirillum sp. RTI4]MEA9983072.1 Nramp family divalent metal transporter [Herbaspirillum sp. RTI4]
MFGLPVVATAPFCPSEVRGSVTVPPGASVWQKLKIYVGPGLLVSIGYMDPGNWATSIQAGSQFGYPLLFVVLLSSLAAIVLQCLCARLGIVTGKDLAMHSRQTYAPAVSKSMWVSAEIAILATDLAEVLGCALAFKLLLGVSLPVGVLLTAFDTLFILGLQGRGFRRIEAIMLGLVATIAICLFTQLAFVHSDWPAVWQGFIPSLQALSGREPLYLAIGILGATVMPHNLYLHSSIVQTRAVRRDPASLREAIRYTRFDTILSLFLAMVINAAILVIAASAFHLTGHTEVVDIDVAYHLLDPITGSALAAILFGVGLFAAGQSSTFTGTIAGQVVMEGFLDLRIPCWQRRLITRGLALIPALAGVLILGEHSVGRLLVMSQVVLSLQLPLAMYPLIRLTSRRVVMGEFVNSVWTTALAWSLFFGISVANVWLLIQLSA